MYLVFSELEEVMVLPANEATAKAFMDFVGMGSNDYSFRDLQIELAGVRGRAVPRQTLEKWLQVCSISTKRKSYTKGHLNKLTALVLYLQGRKATYKGFKAKWSEFVTEVNQRKNNDDEGQSVRTVETECIRV